MFGGSKHPSIPPDWVFAKALASVLVHFSTPPFGYPFLMVRVGFGPSEQLRLLTC